VRKSPLSLRVQRGSETVELTLRRE